VRAADRGQLTPLVLLDLSSAFDTVDHDCLLSVLKNRFSVDGPALDWFQSYLSDRSQTVIAANSKSDPVPVNCSVPQGSVLGPVQFIAYTEDVTELFHKHHLFADDKQVYTHVLPGEEAAGLHKLASCISELQTWCASRCLQLNAAKTELIWFSSRAALQKSSAIDH